MSYFLADWKDFLTAYDGKSITYDGSGNPTSYYNGTRWTFGWTNGRSLTSASNGTTTATYAYNLDGSRSSKTVDGVSHYYLWQDGKPIKEYVDGNSDIFDRYDTLYFLYDENGRPFALIFNGTTYYYVLNLQGDVMRLVDASGNIVAEYTYDPYGNILTATGDLAQINPLRYRSYYYDTELGMYYLNSRYYDPKVGRFINADSYASTGQGVLGYNMYAYCNNSPANFADFGGSIMSGVLRVGPENAIGGSGGCGATSSGSLVDLAVATVVAAVSYVVAAVTKETERKKAESITDAKTITQDPRDVVIYRYGGTAPSNLTPKKKDKYSGLSFSTIPKPGAAMTTINTINATGLVYAVQDSPTHVSVRPIGGSMEDWIEAGSTSPWTQAVKSVVIKIKG